MTHLELLGRYPRRHRFDKVRHTVLINLALAPRRIALGVFLVGRACDHDQPITDGTPSVDLGFWDVRRF